MNRRTCAQLYGNQELTAYIAAQARRHFSCLQDQEDARQEAWMAIDGAVAGMPCPAYKRIAYRAIRAAYMREWRSRDHRTTRSV